MKDPKSIALVVLVSILVGGIGFYGGISYQKTRLAKLSPMGSFLGRPGDQMIRGDGGKTPFATDNRGMSVKPVVGEILNKDDKSITVKLVDGSAKIVLLSQTTSINKAEKVEPGALTVGEIVRVFGTANRDGSVTAQDIQINPEQSQRSQSQEQSVPVQ